MLRRVLLAVVIGSPLCAQAQDMWGADDMRKALTQWLEEHGTHIGEHAGMTPLDERLQLSACSDLSIAPRSARSSSYLMHCHAPENWEYVVAVSQDGRGVTMAGAKAGMALGSTARSWTVVVPRVALPIGTVLSAGDVEERVSDVYPGATALRSIAEAQGLRLTGAVSAGTVLTNYNVAKAPLVMKGETVTLVAHGGGFDISTPGTAEEDGYSGDLIAVRNVKTGIVLKGRVAAGKIIAVASFL